MPIVPSGEANPTVASTSQFCNGGARSGVSGSRAHLPASYATSPLRYVSPKLVDDPPKYGTPPRARALPPVATYVLISISHYLTNLVLELPASHAFSRPRFPLVLSHASRPHTTPHLRLLYRDPRTWMRLYTSEYIARLVDQGVFSAAYDPMQPGAYVSR